MINALILTMAFSLSPLCDLRNELLEIVIMHNIETLSLDEMEALITEQYNLSEFADYPKSEYVFEEVWMLAKQIYELRQQGLAITDIKLTTCKEESLDE